jgi:hypothetical protein
VHRGNLEAVASDADEADEPFFLRADAGFERAASAEGNLLLFRFSEVVELMRSTESVFRRSSERLISVQAASAVRSPVLVARKNRSRWVSIHGPSRISASP